MIFSTLYLPSCIECEHFKFAYVLAPLWNI